MRGKGSLCRTAASVRDKYSPIRFEQWAVSSYPQPCHYVLNAIHDRELSARKHWCQQKPYLGALVLGTANGAPMSSCSPAKERPWADNQNTRCLSKLVSTSSWWR